MKKRVGKFRHLAPRILGILFVLFLMLFSLDVFEPGLTASQIALGLLIHNIPALILFGLLILSWKYEIAGAVTFILAGLVYICLLIGPEFKWYMISWSLIIAGPAFLIGILFLTEWLKKR